MAFISFIYYYLESEYSVRSPSVSSFESQSSSSISSLSESEHKFLVDSHLSIDLDMKTVVKCMASPHSGLDIRDIVWLKTKIPNAFNGSELVAWLCHNVQGIHTTWEARKYANQMLMQGFIKQPLTKSNFCVQCYYVINDMELDIFSPWSF